MMVKSILVYQNQMLFKDMAAVEKEGGVAQAGQRISVVAMECTNFAAM